MKPLGGKRNAARLACGYSRSATWHRDSDLATVDTMNTMKSLARILIGLCLCVAGPATADPSAIEGTWLSGDGDGLIAIEVTGATLSGTILGSATDNPEREKNDVHNPDPALRGRPLVGLELFRGFRDAGDGVWSGGFIYDPDSGNTYRCKITMLDPNTLKVRGFIGVALFGRTETWTRQPD